MENPYHNNPDDFRGIKGEQKPPGINEIYGKDDMETVAKSNAQINSHMARWFFDHAYQQMIWSDGIYELLELDPQQSNADYYNFLEVIHHEDRHIKIHANEELTKTTKPIEITYRLLLNDGRIKWINEICNTDFDQNKNPLRSYGTIQDITKYKLNEESFKYKEERINTLIESLPFAIAICQNNRFSLINRAGKKLFRTENSSELIGELVLKVVHPVSKNYFSEKFESVRIGYQVPTFECNLIRLDGTAFDAEVTLISTSFRGINTIQFIVNDITDKKATEKALSSSKSNLINLAQSTSSILWSVDLAGNIVNLSPAHTDFLGYQYQEILNKNISLFLSKKSFRIVSTWIANKKINNSIHKKQILESVAKDGSTRMLEVIFRPQLNIKEELIGYSGVGRDVTETKNTESQLKKEAIKLNERLVVKNRFFSIIAHDLRVPFNSILGMIDLLESQYDEIDDSEKKKFIKLIEDDTQNTLFLLENLLKWSGTQNGKISYQPEYQKLKPIIDNVVETLNSALQLKGLHIQLNISEDQEIFADKRMLISVFHNLLSNAIKYSYPEGHISISAKTGENETTITVSDTGIGMSEESRNNLFKIDKYRSTPGTAREKGSGLGLILCKEFVEMHNGEIWVESKPERGSQFIFTIPKRN